MRLALATRIILAVWVLCVSLALGNFIKSATAVDLVAYFGVAAAVLFAAGEFAANSARDKKF